jgi:hypothetical protein
MELPRQKPTRSRPDFQFSLAKIFGATTFFAVAVFTGIQGVRLAEAEPATSLVASTGMVAGKLLIVASCFCAGGAIGTLFRNALVGAMIGAFVGFVISGYWGPPPASTTVGCVSRPPTDAIFARWGPN